MMELGVNIDHVATLRQARLGDTPDPILAAVTAQNAGADSIVAHLREDRRHIQDRDIFILKKILRIKFNLEMSACKQIVDIACKVKPHQATLVPEKRQELTTEGGLDLVSQYKKISPAIEKLQQAGIKVSLFIDPDKKQINAAKKMGVRLIELHTGAFAQAQNKSQQQKYLKQLKDAAVFAKSNDLRVFAGHGLDYNNAGEILKIKEIEELNIGYAIICRALFTGIAQAVKEMKQLMENT
jgi:pyridoxine 5-phosphate synthase